MFPGRTPRILYITEGILLRQMQGDPRLTGVSVLVFDEFHERHLEGDVALARALQIQRSTRPDLKIVVMSATLETALLAEYLKPCEILESAGQAFPVTLEYLPKPSDAAIWEQAADACESGCSCRVNAPRATFSFSCRAHMRFPGRSAHCATARPRAVSLFMPSTASCLRPTRTRRSRPARSARSSSATNVAETSLTIDGVRAVIDSGLARMARFDPHRGINTLLIEKISRASAQQRLGRAGRTAAGHGVRLWTEFEHEGRPAADAAGRFVAWN